MKIKHVVLAVAAFLLLLLGVAATTTYRGIEEIRMGGPLQTETQETSALVADIFPPSQYVMEPYLETTLLYDDPESYQERAARLAELRAAYDAGHERWVQSDVIDPALRQQIVEGTHEPAMRFWNELEGVFLPAVRDDNWQEMAASYERLQKLYAQQRAVIDEAAAAAAARNEAVANHSNERLSANLTYMGIVALLFFAAIVGYLIYIQLRVVQPLSAVSGVIKRLTAGEAIEGKIPGEGRSDEIGELSGALHTLATANEEKARMEAAARARTAEQKLVVDTLSEQLGKVAEGDLSADVTADFSSDYALLKQNYNEALASLRALIGSVTESAAAIRNGSGEIMSASEDLARRTEANAASLEETSASLAQVDGRVKATARAAAETVDRADRAISTVASGRAVAEGAVEAMGRVSENAQDIDAVIEGLDKIAFQTRVLAMNAAVEAGRAGEAGRGFAVVADLVSALAMRAEDEAKNAREQLTVTQTGIQSAVDAVTKVDGALAEISSGVGEVHELLGSMARDNQAQASALTQVTAAIGDMDKATQQNAAMVEETSAAARNLSSEVATLAEQAGRFKVGRAGTTTRAPANKVHELVGRAEEALSSPAAAEMKKVANGADVALSGEWNDF